MLLFNSGGDCVAAKLGPGNVHSADDWKQLLLPEIERLQKLGKEVWFRADAAFAKPDIYEALEERGAKYTIRIPANDCLLRDIAELLIRPVGRPGHKPVVWYKGFLYRAAIGRRRGAWLPRWSFMPGTVPPVGLHRDQHAIREPEGRPLLQPARQGGAMDQGRQASGKDDAPECHRFRSNEVRLWLSILAYNLGNLSRRLTLPAGISDWSLISLQQRLVKTGGRLVKHARYYWMVLAEGHLTRTRFSAMLRRIALLPLPAN